MSRPLSVLVASGFFVAAACGGAQNPAMPPPTSVAGTPAGTPAHDAAAAAKFVDEVDRDLRRLWTARDRAGWVNQNFITDDTETLAASAEEATAAYMTKAIIESRKLDGPNLPPDVARKLHLLRTSQLVPAPSDAAAGQELARLQTEMQGIYGKGKLCPEPGSKLAKRLAPKKPGGEKPTCLTLDDLSDVMDQSRDAAELQEAWAGWHLIARPMKDKYARYVEIANRGAKEIGFADMGALWRSGYDMTPDAFEAELARLWTDVKPLYDELHCYVNRRLAKKYGDKVVPAGKPIPAHLLGNMWAQEWTHVYDVVEPYPGQGSLDVTKKIVAKKIDPKGMVKLGESFFTSLGLDPLPASFWQRSLFSRPADREVVCHASAWDVTYNDDLRIKMCIKPNEEDLVTIHHELGHDYYFHAYYKQPMLFQQGANDGFHEGIGDTLALAITPAYLKKIGLLDTVPNNDKAKINVLLKQALEKVSFLPFGYLMDKWRWDVMSGKTPETKYNAAWWELREKIQGVSAPVPRNEDDFDPGAKYHVPASTPYARYFLARIYQFQFYKALCAAAGHQGPLAECTFFGSKAAGDKLQAMLALGASKPWPEAMKAITGQERTDAAPLLEYFQPLRAFLKEQNQGQTCGY